MNYKKYLSELSILCVQKSNQYLDAFNKAESDDTPEVIQMRDEWNASEIEYSAVLNKVKANLGLLSPENGNSNH